jgi:hypothetical protein
MTDSEGSLAKPPLATRLPGVALAVLIGAAAYVARLVPVVRGGGLRGMNSYDGSVYYAAAAGLAHGLRRPALLRTRHIVMRSPCSC